MPKPRPISAACSRNYYKAAHHGPGVRKLKEVTLIVLHSTEGSTAQGAAAWFKSKDSGGSTHLVVDDAICYRCLANEDIPWAAPGANRQGFHIEQAGFARWSAAIWTKHRVTIQRAAYKAALHAKLFGIPITYLKAPALKAGNSGITTHRECTKAWGGDHTDPGPLYPLPLFMYWCRRYRKQLG